MDGIHLTMDKNQGESGNERDAYRGREGEEGKEGGRERVYGPIRKTPDGGGVEWRNGFKMITETSRVPILLDMSRQCSRSCAN